MQRVLTKSSNLFKLLGSPKGVSGVSIMRSMGFKALLVDVPKEFVYHVKINRPEKRNALNHELFLEIKECFEKLNDEENCRVVVFTGKGKNFTAGIDLNSFLEQGTAAHSHPGDLTRKAKILHKLIKTYQDCVSAMEKCQKPVISAVHSACIGAGVDLITAADVRYASEDAYFQIKEVDVGLAADVGTLQRLPKVVGSDSLVRELCYTARKMDAQEALKWGLISGLFHNKDELIKNALNLAEEIAGKSPVAVQTTKLSLNFSRDHSVQEGLDHIKNLNQMNLQSEDLVTAATGQLTKDKNIIFSKL